MFNTDILESIQEMVGEQHFTVFHGTIAALGHGGTANPKKTRCKHENLQTDFAGKFTEKWCKDHPGPNSQH